MEVKQGSVREYDKRLDYARKISRHTLKPLRCTFVCSRTGGFIWALVVNENAIHVVNRINILENPARHLCRLRN